MKQALYMGQKNIKLQEASIPKCGDNDVLLKNIYAGICGTDVAVFNYGPNTGHRVNVGGEFGHEMVSEVVEVGKNKKVGELCTENNKNFNNNKTYWNCIGSGISCGYNFK